MSFKKRLLALSIVFLATCSAFPAVAGATYYVVPWEASGYYYGAYGWNYVEAYPVQLAYFSNHLNSIYAQRVDGQAYVEVGWVAWRGNPKFRDRWPIYFIQWLHRGYRYTRYGNYVSVPGTDHRFMVHWQNSPNNEWHFLIDGGLVAIGALPEPYGLRDAQLLADSERHDLFDTNYAHFWSLQRSDSNQNWSWWTRPQQYLDNDPYYRLRIISNTETLSTL